MPKSIWKRDLIPPSLKPYVWSVVTLFFITGTFMEWSDVFSTRPSVSPPVTLSDYKWPAISSIFAALCVFATFVSWKPWCRQRRQTARVSKFDKIYLNKHCKGCGHILQGSHLHCPECGKWHGATGKYSHR